MTLKEKIENEIIKINKPHADGGYIQGKVDALRWVLSEFKKMTCENCKYKNSCNKRETWIETNEDIKRIDDITFCSLWEENENINQ